MLKIDTKQPKTARNILEFLALRTEPMGIYSIDRSVSSAPGRDRFFAPDIALKDLEREGLVEEARSSEGRLVYQITDKGREAPN